MRPAPNCFSIIFTGPEFTMVRLFSDSTVQNAAFLAHLASAAYKDVPQSYDLWSELGMNCCQIFASGDMASRGFVAADDYDIYLAFRGTDDIKDFITDINILMVRGYGGRVHKGFSDALESVWEKVREIYRELKEEKPDAKIWVTGHSLGGALAMLCGQRLIDEKLIDPASIAVFTFGQPRVGDDAFSQNYRANLCRFYHRYDIVPAVPPPEIMPEFTHVGDHLWLSGKAGKVQNKPFNWVPLTVQATINQLLQTIRIQKKPHWVTVLGGAVLVSRGISDHGMKKYLQALNSQ